MVTAPSAPDVVAEGVGGDVLAGAEAVADGGALTTGFGVGVGVETTEGSDLPTYTTAATTIANVSAASAAFRIV